MCAPATLSEASERKPPNDAQENLVVRPESSLIAQRPDRALSGDTPRTMKKVLAKLHSELGTKIEARVKHVGLHYPPSRIALVALKEEREVEVWGANADSGFVRIHTYPIRGASGVAGPKTRQGDLQVPEGQYRLSLMNPASQYHLSMKVSYPNKADRKQAGMERRAGLGGAIYIHGSNVSIGCIAIGDRAIEELFLLVGESGHANAEVIIAPADLRLQKAPHDSRPWVMKRYERIVARLAKLGRPLGEELAQSRTVQEARRAYALTRTRLLEYRKELEKAHRSADTNEARKRILAEARTVLVDGLTGTLFPAWYGTRWSFNGISEVPGKGSVACGVFAGTLLRDAGFNLSRIGMGRLASEHIAQRLTGEGNIRRYSDRPVGEVISDLQSWGPGLYLVGLDFHVGFMFVDDQNRVHFVHSSYVGRARVISERADGETPFLHSRYRVLAKLFDDAMIQKWLVGARFSTRKKAR